MLAVAALETGIPLRARQRAHLRTNLALTLLTLATNALANTVLVTALVRLEPAGFGLLRLAAWPPLLTAAVTITALDLGAYAVHVAMHKVPVLWRVHAVHHADPAVDVTTSLRQHPGEGVLRYGAMAGVAVALGATPGAFAVYRLWSALNALLEHANVRPPLRLDALCSLVVATPNMHKVHHSRWCEETDSNYGNIFALFDRFFATFTPSERGPHVTFGLDGFDDPARQTTAALLALPFQRSGAMQVAGVDSAPRLLA
jgi:sterol desaturase/sphingolipid hydroxylase (fatty acid hydroxylase superfamily)